MTSQNTQQQTDDIQNESSESLNNSKIRDSETLNESTNNEQNELIGSLSKSDSSVTLKNDAISEDNSLNLQLSLESDPICWIENGQKKCLPH
ncbi:hypothetical protein [Nostoc sp.]|uniref:hypothetical protein n=1 Tax=Nostoc sp. TaxID=1180 RepID=UPI002FFB2382